MVIRNPHAQPAIRLSLLAATLLALSACDKAHEGEYASADSTVGYADSYAESVEVGDQAMDVGQASLFQDELQAEVQDEQSASHAFNASSLSSNPVLANKKMIVHAHADFRVDDVVKTTRIIETLAKNHQGYVSDSEILNNEYNESSTIDGDDIVSLISYQRYANLTVRVPTARLDSFLEQLKTQITFLQASGYTAEDVTIDIAEKQLMARLDGQRAEALNDDALNATDADEQDSNVARIDRTYDAKTQQALSQIAKRRLEDQVQFATVRLSYHQPEAVFERRQQNLEAVIETYEPDFATLAKQQLANGWDTLKQALLFLLGLWWLVVVVLLLIPLWYAFLWAWKFIRKQFKRIEPFVDHGQK